MLILDWISDLLWPLSCLGCGSPGIRLCDTCISGLSGNGHLVHREVPDLDRLLWVGLMRTEALSRAIWHLKYRNMPQLAERLAQLLATEAGRAGILPARGSIVVPVPLHARRLRARGYNQAGLLAEHFAAIALLSCRTDCLVRVRATASQVGTSDREERRANMEGAFACPNAATVRGRAILLVDDVATTGSTLSACAAALRSAGARSVTGLVLARG